MCGPISCFSVRFYLFKSHRCRKRTTSERQLGVFSRQPWQYLGTVARGRSHRSYAGDARLFTFTLSKLVLWSHKTPALYRIKVTLKSKHGEHTINERFGICSTDWVDNGTCKLNGERLLLKATHYHEDHAGVAAAVPDDVVRKTLTMIKDMGANFVRLGTISRHRWCWISVMNLDCSFGKNCPSAVVV